MINIEELLSNEKNQEIFDEQIFSINFAIEINNIMEKQGLTRSDLARKLNTSRSNVTQILSGNRNLTSRNIGRILRVLECLIQIRPQNEYSTNEFAFDDHAPCKIFKLEWDGYQERRQINELEIASR